MCKGNALYLQLARAHKVTYRACFTEFHESRVATFSTDIMRSDHATTGEDTKITSLTSHRDVTGPFHAAPGTTGNRATDRAPRRAVAFASTERTVGRTAGKPGKRLHDTRTHQLSSNHSQTPTPVRWQAWFAVDYNGATDRPGIEAGKRRPRLGSADHKTK